MTLGEFSSYLRRDIGAPRRALTIDACDKTQRTEGSLGGREMPEMVEGALVNKIHSDLVAVMGRQTGNDA